MKKRLVLRALELTQFQKFDHMVIPFLDGVTNISGDNGEGKTVIYSAFTFLLFGKDSIGRKVFEAQRRINGQTQTGVRTAVSGMFDLYEGESVERITLRRELVETKDEANGTSETVTECYVNDVPYKVRKFQAYIEDIIPEKEFALITSVTAFLNLDTKEQRQMLIDIAGDIDIDAFVAGTEYESTWAGKPNNVSFDDYLRLKEEQLKKHKADKKNIEPAINALALSRPQELNWVELEERKAALKAEIDTLNEEINTTLAANESQITKRAEALANVVRAKAELQQAEDLFKTECRRAREDYQREKTKAEEKLKTVHTALESNRALMEATEEKQTALEEAIKSLRSSMDEVYEAYNAEYATEFALSCPFNGKACNYIDVDQKAVMQAEFEQRKQAKLSELLSKGKSFFAQCEEKENKLLEVKRDYLTAFAKIESIETEEKKLAEALATFAVPFDQTDEYGNIVEVFGNTVENKRKALEEAQKEQNSAESEMPDISAQKKRIEELNAQTEEVIKQLAVKEQIESVNALIEKKRYEGVVLADMISEWENDIHNLKMIRRMMAEEASARLSSVFKVTHWTMIEQQKDGEWKDVCKPDINGISLSLNAATKLNIGLDICQALSNYRGVSAPVFIDNRESANEIIPVEGMQIINLRVAPKGTPLKITYND